MENQTSTIDIVAELARVLKFPSGDGICTTKAVITLERDKATAELTVSLTDSNEIKTFKYDIAAPVVPDDVEEK